MRSTTGLYFCSFDGGRILRQVVRRGVLVASGPPLPPAAPAALGEGERGEGREEQESGGETNAHGEAPMEMERMNVYTTITENVRAFRGDEPLTARVMREAGSGCGDPDCTLMREAGSGCEMRATAGCENAGSGCEIRRTASHREKRAPDATPDPAPAFPHPASRPRIPHRVEIPHPASRPRILHRVEIRIPIHPLLLRITSPRPT